MNAGELSALLGSVEKTSEVFVLSTAPTRVFAGTTLDGEQAVFLVGDPILPCSRTPGEILRSS